MVTLISNLIVIILFVVHFIRYLCKRKILVIIFLIVIRIIISMIILFIHSLLHSLFSIIIIWFMYLLIYFLVVFLLAILLVIWVIIIFFWVYNVFSFILASINNLITSIQFIILIHLRRFIITHLWMIQCHIISIFIILRIHFNGIKCITWMFYFNFILPFHMSFILGWITINHKLKSNLTCLLLTFLLCFDHILYHANQVHHDQLGLVHWGILDLQNHPGRYILSHHRHFHR